MHRYSWLFLILQMLFAPLSVLAGAASSLPITSERIQLMLNQGSSYVKAGPNCYSSVLFASGFIDDWALVDDGLDKVLASSGCKELESISEVQPGDIFTIEGFAARYTNLRTHTGLFVSSTEIFAKMGNAPQNMTAIENAKNNINLYMSSGASNRCRKNAFNSKFKSTCLEDSLFPNYYRCDFKALRNEIENSSVALVWRELSTVRKKLAAATLSPISDADIVQIQSSLQKMHISLPAEESSEIVAIVIGFLEDAKTQADLLIKTP